MKTKVISISGQPKDEISLSKAFSQSVRKDLINKAVLAERNAARTPYGADPLAGKRTSAHYHGRRAIRWAMMNREMSRMKRIHNSGFLNYTARFIPGVIKGRKAHPPKAEKNWKQKINRSEWKNALFSAVSATSKLEKDVEPSFTNVKAGVSQDIKVPIIVDDKLESIKKTKKVKEFLVKIGLEKELERAAKRTIRAGKGTMRGRKYKKRRGPLIVIKEDKGIVKAGRNIPGVNVVPVDMLLVSDLAPGGNPRVVVWSESAAKGINTATDIRDFEVRRLK